MQKERQKNSKHRIDLQVNISQSIKKTINPALSQSHNHLARPSSFRVARFFGLFRIMVN